MLDKAEIRKEIARLEYEESSYPNYAKLADLYVIRDKMQEEERGDGGRHVGSYSGAPAPVTAEPAIVGEYGDSVAKNRGVPSHCTEFVAYNVAYGK